MIQPQDQVFPSHGDGFPPEGGITMRSYFAILILAGKAAGGSSETWLSRHSVPESVALADQLIAELNKPYGQEKKA